MAKKERDNVRGDHNTFQAGSMMVKFVQNNYNKVPGGWAPADEDDYCDYEEVDPRKTADGVMGNEPNYFQAGRFLKSVLNGDWFEEVRTHSKYTKKWREGFVEALIDSDYGWDIAVMWSDQSKREVLKAYIVGCLKDSGVISGAYDQIARQMGYDESYRSFSRNIGRGKNQEYFQWTLNYVAENK